MRRLIPLLLAACNAAPAVPEAEPWPAADALFRRDPRWLGGDAVYSVDLRDGRILWLFGDSFVATDQGGDRRNAVMVRNTIAVQTGADPERAHLAFHWRDGEQGRPAAFFADDGEIGHWPLHGVRLEEGPLLLFGTRVRATPGQGLGFALEGWRLLRVDDVDREPAAWRVRELTLPPLVGAAIVGVAVVRQGPHVIALATFGHGPHRGVLARLPIDALLRDDVRVQWWDGAGWCEGASRVAATVLDDAGPEGSIDRVAGGWRHVASRGFGATTVAVRVADELVGPWSAPRDVFVPPESRGERPFVYAAKAHPCLDAGPGRFAVSYAANSFAFGDLFTAAGQSGLYWPRFWRVRNVRP